MSILLHSGVAVQVWRQAAFRRHPSLVPDSQIGRLILGTCKKTYMCMTLKK